MKSTDQKCIMFTVSSIYNSKRNRAERDNKNILLYPYFEVWLEIMALIF